MILYLHICIPTTPAHSQTARRMLWGERGKNSSDLSLAVTKPLSAWLCQSKAETRWQAAGAGSSFSQASFILKNNLTLCIMTSLDSFFFQYLLLATFGPWIRGLCDIILQYPASEVCVLSNFNVTFKILLAWSWHSLRGHLVWGQCREQSHHPRGEVLHIWAAQRDFPERLWAFV